MTLYGLLAIFLLAITHLGSLFFGVWITQRIQAGKPITPQKTEKLKPIFHTDEELYFLEKEKEGK